jgi:hypothetical protein
MKTQDVLSSIQLGYGVTELDKDLEQYFIRTRLFDDFISDQVDLVLGVKGSGKSAIARIVVNDRYRAAVAPKLDTVPAFDLRGDLNFLRLRERFGGADAESLVLFWRLYICATSANHFADNYAQHGGASIGERLEVLGLRIAKMTERRTLWTRLFDRWRDLLNYDPIIVAGSPAATLRHEALLNELEEILEVVRAALSAAGRSLWVIVDRLDEAFDSRDFERRAIRALLQVSRDFRAHRSRSVALKVFLRTDLLNRVTRDPERSVNLTHVPKESIEWRKDKLLQVLSERLSMSGPFLTSAGLTARPDHDSDRLVLLRALIPVETPNELTTHTVLVRRTWDWMSNYLRDGSNSVAPRNLLTFLGHAIGEQRDLLTVRGSANKASTPLLSGTALNRAWMTVSKERLTDTVRAEDPELNPYVDLFDRARCDYGSLNALARQLRMNRASAEFRDVHERLSAVGFIRELGNDRHAIAEIYRPALRIVSRPASGGRR